MRPDMDKVIVERPRYGSRSRSRKKGYRKQLQKSDFAELPRNEPMLGRWRGLEKCFNEHLGPMRRFLRSQVGRPWNHVYRDLREHVRFDNVVQKHVLTHVWEFVHRHVDVIDGQIVVRPGTGWRRTLHTGEMYVCPKSGHLKIIRSPSLNTDLPHRIQFDPLVQYHRQDNAWWEVRLRELPDEPEGLWDAWLEQPVSADRCWAAFGGKYMAISKRLLSLLEAKLLHRRMRKLRSE